MTDRKLAIEAWESLFRAQHEIFERIEGDFAASELLQAEYDVLLTVTRAPEMTTRLRDVTTNMLISQPSVSRLVDRMVAKGLLTKCPDPEDGRGSLVTASAEGAHTFRTVATRHGRHIAEQMSVLSADDLRSLLQVTQKLRSERR